MEKQTLTIAGAPQTETTVRKLNGKKITPTQPDAYQERLADIEKQKADLAAENARRQEEYAQLVQQEQEAYQAHQQSLREQKNMYRNMARNYRDLALEADDKDRTNELLQYALECETQAAKIIIEGEPEEAPLLTENEAVAAIWEKARVHKLLAIGQVVILLAILAYTFGMFEEFRQSMIAQNKELIKQAVDNPGVKLLNPYDISSFQKYAFESFVEFMDLPKALLKMLIFAPFLLYYLYRHFWKDFFTGLSAWQRTIFLLGLFATFLLHSALSHLVSP